MRIEFVWDDGADQSIGLPLYASSGAAGADIRANFSDRSSQVLEAGVRLLVPTGLRIAIPVGFEVQLRPRSGLALKHGITLPNAPGTIDSDYRGPLGIILMNAGTDSFVVEIHGCSTPRHPVHPPMGHEPPKDPGNETVFHPPCSPRIDGRQCRLHSRE